MVRYAQQVLTVQRFEQIQIPQNEAVFGDDADRMLVLEKHLQQLAGNPKAAVGRLVAVGVAAERDDLRVPIAGRQALVQQLSRVLFDHDHALKVHPCAVAPVGMGVPGIAVCAAMFAPPLVSVDAVYEGDIRTVVAAEDVFGKHLQVACAVGLSIFLFQSAVFAVGVVYVVLKGLESVVRVVLGPAAFAIKGGNVHGIQCCQRLLRRDRWGSFARMRVTVEASA